MFVLAFVLYVISRSGNAGTKPGGFSTEFPSASFLRLFVVLLTNIRLGYGKLCCGSPSVLSQQPIFRSSQQYRKSHYKSTVVSGANLLCASRTFLWLNARKIAHHPIQLSWRTSFVRSGFVCYGVCAGTCYLDGHPMKHPCSLLHDTLRPLLS